jgi:twitching motility protein PilT
MSKPVYEIPIGDGEAWPSASGRRAAPSAFSFGMPVIPAAPAELVLPPEPEPEYESATNRAPQAGEGQEGSDPELVRALNAVVAYGASDLHVTVKAAPMVRVDGGLRPIEGFPIWNAERVTTALHSILTDKQREIFEAELELDFAYRLSETARFRVNIYQQRNVIGAAFRLIPTQIKQLSSLGIPERIGTFAQLARGLVLVTGPTGSGKSTTLAALIDLVNSTRADHIVTVEDPIEFMHDNKKSLVNQREVGHDTHSFANALKHVLRQDPDVILIGELRDLETISVALTAAETGHLVFATLHTQDAAQTIDRVIDVFPPHQQGQVRAQLAATLQGVVCQTLVKKVGGGRVVATEVLVTTPAISNLIREGKTFQIASAMQAGRDVGMHTMDQHLADLVNGGQITHEAAYEKAQSLDDLKQLIQRASAVTSSQFGNSY